MGEVGNWDGAVVLYALTAPVTSANRDAALRRLDAALLPAGEEVIVLELARLRALTTSRDVGVDLALVLDAYAEELQRYPGDLVVEVLRAWPRTGGRFWPAAAELIERLDRMTMPRLALREALRRGYQAPEVSPDWTPPPSAAEKAEVDALLARHGITVSRDGRVRRPGTAPMNPADHARVAAETRGFRLPDADDPRVQGRLMAMGEAG